ncbi:MAG: ATPase [Ferruginibacter sp.]|nr:ATPase [Ferruginibacter sp.]
MKFSINEFIIDKKYAAVLRNKIGNFKAITNTKKAIFLTMKITYGIVNNDNAMQLVSNNLSMEVLFEK